MSLESNPYRLLPSVDDLLQHPAVLLLVQQFSRALVVDALRYSLEQARAAIRSGLPCPSREVLLNAAEQMLIAQQRAHLVPVVNATGVILHTNLGRAPLSKEALQAVLCVAEGYSNLEYDLERGERGSRQAPLASLLCAVTGAEAALVTNNNASAVLLCLTALAVGREVVISRGQLVEIGGGFRVPDVMRQSGCHLVEVGTTNRTRLTDYQQALSERTAAVLSVHPGNFLITGFTESPALCDMALLAHQHDVLLMHDLGSGCLVATERYGLAHEPTPQESLADGADLVCFSGDKLLGGPQAGIIVGRKEIIARLSRHPLMRAVRVDKMTLAALEATLHHYQRGQVESHIPIWRMISASPELLARRAHNWMEQLQAQGIHAHVLPGESTIGGGSLPGEMLPTTLLALYARDFPDHLDTILHRLRQRSSLSIVARISHDMLLFDPRTVLAEQDNEILSGLLECIGAKE